MLCQVAFGLERWGRLKHHIVQVINRHLLWILRRLFLLSVTWVDLNFLAGSVVHLHEVLSLTLALRILNLLESLIFKFFLHSFNFVLLVYTFQPICSLKLQCVFNLVGAVLQDDERLLEPVKFLDVVETDKQTDLWIDILFKELHLHK